MSCSLGLLLQIQTPNALPSQTRTPLCLTSKHKPTLHTKFNKEYLRIGLNSIHFSDAKKCRLAIQVGALLAVFDQQSALAVTGVNHEQDLFTVLIQLGIVAFGYFIIMPVKKMPRKPTRHNRLLRSQPLTFSPFARSLSYAASAYLTKQRLSDSVVYGKSAKKSIDNGFSKESLEEKNELSESLGEEEFEGVVQADFEFFDPKPDDFHGVKILLQTYLDNEEWDLSGFVDLILGQTTVGTVVKVEDDEDEGLFSVITVLNLARYKGHKCIMELKNFLFKVCQEKYVMDELRLLLGEQVQNVGLLVSQRVLNLPPQLFPPMYDALFDEISWATEDEVK